VLLLKECKVAVNADNLLHENQPETKSIFSGVKTILANRFFWVILCFFAVSSLPGWGVKNWLPTLFAENLHLNMSVAGPIATITIAFSSLLGVLGGGFLSDKWVQKNVRGRIYTSAIGLSLTIPALLLLGFGHSLFHLMAAAFCFGIGFGMFDANNMPIVCQFIAPAHRATAYGMMNMVGVFAGSMVTNWLGKSVDKGSLGKDFAALALVIAIATAIQLFSLRPKSIDYQT
jgi:MFS family permease